MTRKLATIMALLLGLAACDVTGTAPPMKADTNGLTPLGAAHGP